MPEHGGYRRPSNPAPVSGPGAHSKRTDGRAQMMDLPDAQYGEGAAFQEIQQGAPLGGGASPAAALPSAPSRPIVGLGEPTMMPDTPVTAGAEYGPGPSQAVLGVDPTSLDSQQFAKYMPFFLKLANDPNTPKSTRTLIRQLFTRS
jgi:hypothetical protein